MLASDLVSLNGGKLKCCFMSDSFFNIILAILFTYRFISFILLRQRFKRRTIIEGTIVGFNQDIDFSSNKRYVVKTVFVFKGLSVEISDFVNEKLFKYKMGNSIKVYVNDKNLSKSTINGEFRIDDFIANILPDFVILSVVIIARFFSK